MIADDRRYVCTACDSVARARWSQWGDGYPGYFEVGCDCTIVPVVPEMSQAETPDEWRVERPECCRGVDVKDLEECYGGVSDYRCPECGATYRWDGTMSTAPESEEQSDPPDDQQLLTDGGTDQHVERDHHALPEWYWRVVVHTEERGELILSAHEPHRAAAKRYIADRLEIEVLEWRDTYVPRATWDCPACGVHEGATEQPNLRGDHDWECLNCGTRFWGEPMEWDRIEEGPWVPEWRSGVTKQSTLGDSDG